MQVFQIEPLVGVGPVRFGMTRDEVEAHVGRGREVNIARHLHFGALFVNYDKEGHVEFIEAAESKEFVVTFHGADLHALAAEDAVRFVSRWAPYNPSDPEFGYTFLFPDLELSL